jgi:hypothetical protein
MATPSLIEIAIGSPKGAGGASHEAIGKALKACFDAAKAGKWEQAADAFCLACEAHEMGADPAPPMDHDEGY